MQRPLRDLVIPARSSPVDSVDLTERFVLPDVGLLALSEADLCWLRRLTVLARDGIFCQTRWQGQDTVLDLLPPGEVREVYSCALRFHVRRGPAVGKPFFKRILLHARTNYGDGVLVGHAHTDSYFALAVWNRQRCVSSKYAIDTHDPEYLAAD
jgi:hypothetical protein